MRKKPGNTAAARGLADAYVRFGDWPKALKEFAALGIEAAIYECNPTDAKDFNALKAADYWWGFSEKNPEPYRIHASAFYRKAIEDGLVDGLMKILVEKRIKETARETNVQPLPTTQDATFKGKYKFNYRLDKKGNAILCGTPCVSSMPIGVLAIPYSIDDHKVVGIDEHALDGCDKITKIELPSGMEWLPRYGKWPCHGKLFVPCKALLQIEIPDDNAHFASVDGILYTKDKKCLIAYPKAKKEFKLIPGVESIGYNACEGCQFDHVSLQGSINYVGPWAFEGCSRLKTVECLKPDRGLYFGICPFKNDVNLKRFICHGDAPGCRGALFSYAPGDIVVEVKKGSKGWKAKDSMELPERWPLNGSSRPIRYIQ